MAEHGFAKPLTRWYARAHHLGRQPLLVRQLLAVTAATALALSLLYLFHLRPGNALHVVEDERTASATSVFLPDPPSHPVLPIPHHEIAPPHEDEHSYPVAHTPQDNAITDSDSDVMLEVDAPPSSPPPPPAHPVTFALIMFTEDAASEGAILLKSIMMYTSVDVDVYIICDEQAQAYLERRLALVKRPRYNLRVWFYRLSWDAMRGRIDREGTVNTVHVAGVPGLMKLFIHEILPTHVKRVIFVDTDAFFISDPLLLWQQFDSFNETTAISLPSHPEMFAPQWFDANKICSCIMLLDLDRFRQLRLMDSSAYRAAGLEALAPAAFRALFGEPDAATGRYEEVALGDQSFWWAIVSFRPDIFRHLHYDWEVSSCLLDMYMTGLGQEDADEADELGVQLHTWATPHQGEVIMPKLVHFNCLEGPRYHDWHGWEDPTNSLTVRWGSAVKYHAGFKWLWLNQGQKNETSISVETVSDVRFADEMDSP